MRVLGWVGIIGEASLFDTQCRSMHSYKKNALRSRYTKAIRIPCGICRQTPYSKLPHRYPLEHLQVLPPKAKETRLLRGLLLCR
jgi:hypothetical protein